MDKINVCAYCRVSTNSLAQEDSFEYQKNYFEREIAKDERYELVRVYAEKGLSGTSLLKRPEFNEMINDAGVDVEYKKDSRGRIVNTDYTRNLDRETNYSNLFFYL